jgi:fatty-acyl-CoA synthase
MNPIDFFWRAVQRHPDRLAVIAPGGSLSFAALGRKVQALAAALQHLDPVAGNRIGLGAINSDDHLVSLLAILASGKTWVPLNPRSGTPDLRRIVDFTEPSILMLDSPMLQRLGDLSPRVVGIGDAGGEGAEAMLQQLHRYRDAQCLPVDRPLSDVQAIKFTGGTTGIPKGVMQGCRAWNTMIASQLHAFGFNETDRFLMSAPLTHGSSTYVLPILGAGGCLVFPAETRAGAILDSIEQQGVTTLFVPPVMVHMLVQEQAVQPRNTASLRNIIYGAAPMSEQRIREAQQCFGQVLSTTYGQTEAPQIISWLGARELADARNVASVGRAGLLTRVAIAGADGRPVTDAGVEGEVLVRGDLVMNGYWRNPEKTAETLVDGWLHTGDIGLLDERGFLFLKGRSDDVIISGGFNVHPSDVEAVLVRFPGVGECCVVGLPDEKWGEVVTAAITLKPGQSVSVPELIAYAKAELGSVLAPKAVHVLQSLPRTAVDKVPRKLVRQAIEDLLSGQGG